MSGVLSYSTLEPTSNDNKFSLLAKILLATLQGGGSGPTAPATFVSNMVGVVLDYAGTTAPSGFLLCFGQTVSRATYSALFAKIGTTFGAGDGSTTFVLPDLRGRVVAGQDDMGGTSANRLTNPGGGGVNGDTFGAAGGAETQVLSPTSETFAYGADEEVAASVANNIVQPTIILNKIIFTGVA